jgi:hypothetical protein
VSDIDLSLEEAVIGAGEAPPSRRIEFRDPIARHGSAGIDRVKPWLSDPKMAAFAVRVIARAADFGAADEARRVLSSALSVLVEPGRSDAQIALSGLGVSAGRSATRRHPADRATTVPAISVEDFVVDRVYRRRDIHDGGLGGNRQKGISYPANGTYVLLFSDPGSTHDWGYKDTWLGSDGYQYYGEWNGTGDMLPIGGNLALVDRSPEIYLFVKVSGGHRFAGRFACVNQDRTPATRDGKEYSALVFTLERAASRQV